jgi:hemoglobin-like flavoprotein
LPANESPERSFRPVFARHHDETGHEAIMTPEREQLVRDTWKRFEPKAAEHARFFYDKLFELDPETKAMFARANMDIQRHRLMETFGMLVTELDDAERLVSDLVVLGRRHGAYGVRDSDYDAAGVALLWTLERALGPEFTAEARSAWTEAYTTIATVMRRISAVTTGTHKVHTT